jgi:hypothetical protein
VHALSEKRMKTELFFEKRAPKRLDARKNVYTAAVYAGCPK